MHKFTFKTLLATPFLCLALLSCQNEELSTGASELPQEAQETVDYLVEYEGYDSNLFKFDPKTNSLIYNGDYAIAADTKANMDRTDQEARENGIVSKNQWMGNSRVAYSNSRNIKYYFVTGDVANPNYNFPREYYSAFSWAAYHWSRVSPNINFRRVYNQRDANVIVAGYSDSRDVAWARAQLPR